MNPNADASMGHLLGGRIRYAQPRTGFRSGIEPVLLAAAIPARPGERVIEAGTGAGAALLCLAARPQTGASLRGVGIERDAAMLALARRNAADNGFSGLEFLQSDIAALPELGQFDHGFANPPYHAPDGSASPLPARETAKRAHDGSFGIWVTALGRVLRHRGSLTLIVPAAAVPACMAAMEAAQCRPSALLPLWPKTGRAAKLVLLRGIKGGRGAFRVTTGLTLHPANGIGFTSQAQAILRDGATLDI